MDGKSRKPADVECECEALGLAKATLQDPKAGQNYRALSATSYTEIQARRSIELCKKSDCSNLGRCALLEHWANRAMGAVATNNLTQGNG